MASRYAPRRYRRAALQAQPFKQLVHQSAGDVVALGRLLQRHRGVDLDAALPELHRNILRPSLAVRARLGPGRAFLIPAAASVFLCEMTGGHDVSLGGCQVAHARAKTWLSNDQLWDAQEKQTAPLATLPDDEPLGASLLLPAPVQLAGRAVSARLRDCVEAERLPRDLTPERHDLVIRTVAKEIVAADGPS